MKTLTIHKMTILFSVDPLHKEILGLKIIKSMINPHEIFQFPSTLDLSLTKPMLCHYIHLLHCLLKVLQLICDLFTML